MNTGLALIIVLLVLSLGLLAVALLSVTARWATRMAQLVRTATSATEHRTSAASGAALAFREQFTARDAIVSELHARMVRLDETISVTSRRLRTWRWAVDAGTERQLLPAARWIRRISLLLVAVRWRRAIGF